MLFIIIGTYLKTKKATILDLTGSTLNYSYLSNKIEKKNILKVELIHGHVSSFALIFVRSKTKFKVYEFSKMYNNYGTPYLVNLDKIEGKVSEIYQEILEWNKRV